MAIVKEVRLIRVTTSTGVYQYAFLVSEVTDDASAGLFTINVGSDDAAKITAAATIQECDAIVKRVPKYVSITPLAATIASSNTVTYSAATKDFVELDVVTSETETYQALLKKLSCIQYSNAGKTIA